MKENFKLRLLDFSNEGLVFLIKFNEKITEMFINIPSIIIITNIKEYKMEITTIAVKKELRDKISEFGMKGETFSDVLERLLKSAQQRMLQDILMDTEGCLTIEEARKELNKKWPKSK